jgi:hypothetical protein
LALAPAVSASRISSVRTNGTLIPTASQFSKLDPGGAPHRQRGLEALLSHDPITYLAYLFIPAVLWFVQPPHATAWSSERSARTRPPPTPWART